MASDMFLFWASGSPPCWRVMLALEEKGLAGYPNKFISFDKKENKGEDLLKWNPRGQVPTFVHNNRAINESLAACDYLEATFKNQGRKLLPDDAAELGQVLQRKYEFLNLDRKGQDYIHYVLRSKPESIDKEECQKRLNDFYEELKIWEKYVAENETNGYLSGKNLSLADIVFFPNLAFYVRVGLQLAKSYPHLAKYYEAMCKLPAVEKTWPPHWKGTEAPSKVFQ